MMNGQTASDCRTGSAKCISWSAIFAGALVGIGLSFLVNLFCLAIGVSAFTAGPDGALNFAIGGFIGLVIGAIASMFMAGWVAGHMSKAFCTKRNFGALYGFAAWCVALLVMIMIASNVARFVTFHASYATNPQQALMSVSQHKKTMMMKSEKEATAEVVVSSDKPNTLMLGAYITFILFFLSAISSCVGGYCGLSCKQKDCSQA